MADPYASFSSPSADPYAGIATPTKATPKVGRSEGVAQAFGSGALFNFGDEAAAAVRAISPGFADWMMSGPALKRDESIGGSPEPQTTSRAGSIGERYDEELAKERTKAKTFKESNPVLATGANIAGNIAGGIATAPALPGGLVSRSASGVVNALKAATVGAGYGALAGAGEGEGGEGRAANALLGGTMGAAFGAAVPPVTALARSVAESAPGRWIGSNVLAPALRGVDSVVTPAVQNTASAVLRGKLPDAPYNAIPAKSLSAAADGGGGNSILGQLAEAASNIAPNASYERIATAVQRSGRSPEELQRMLTRYGPEAVLADLDPQLTGVATGLKVLPGQTRSTAENVLVPRDRRAGNRLVSAFEGSEDPPSSFALRGEGQAFDQNRRAVGARAYQGDMKDAGLKQTPELMALYENPYVDKALNEVMSVERNSRIGRPDATPSSPIEILHKVKQKIWDMGFDEATARPGPNASYYRDLGTDFMDKLKAANPALAAADREYAQAASLPEFFDAGRNFLKRGTSEGATAVSGPGLGDMLGSANVQQQAATRAGATNAARETALEGTRPARALAQRIDESSLVRDKLVQIYGSSHADQIMRRAEAEGVFANTSNKVLRGSQTAEKLSDALDMGGAGVRVSPSGITPRVFETFNALKNWVVNPNEGVRDQMGRMMLSQDPAENARLLRIVSEILSRRQNGNVLSPGYSAAAGSTGASQ